MAQIARTRDLSEVEKALWMIAVVFAPLLGALVWYFAGPHPFGVAESPATKPASRPF
ncbi:PLD nuclease N-terminal domain-containing protein [Cryobacterium sp. HLT2-28]|uniref:PLD nuclease N-terminal domain-containing protein n=1 Tax=Cryobacterium sp. HLT2-28 TaxID=1259146 RepID=UPI003518FBCC